MKRRIGLLGSLATLGLILGNWTAPSTGGSLAADASPSEILIHYEYDELQRLVRVEYGDGQSITYDYDARGNLLGVVRADG